MNYLDFSGARSQAAIRRGRHRHDSLVLPLPCRPPRAGSAMDTPALADRLCRRRAARRRTDIVARPDFPALALDHRLFRGISSRVRLAGNPRSRARADALCGGLTDRHLARRDRVGRVRPMGGSRRVGCPRRCGLSSCRGGCGSQSPTVGFSVQLVKNTALAAVISFIELAPDGDFGREPRAQRDSRRCRSARSLSPPRQVLRGCSREDHRYRGPLLPAQA